MKKTKKVNFDVVQTIVTIAKGLENAKLAKKVIDEIQKPLDMMSLYLNTTKEQSLLFSVIFALQARINIIDLRDIINFLDISYIDSLPLKADIDTLLEKNLIEIEEDGKGKFRKSKYGKSSFSIPDEISDQIYANLPIIQKAQMPLDIYGFLKDSSSLVEKRKYENLTTLELFIMVEGLETSQNHISPISDIKSKLAIADRIILYEILYNYISYYAQTSAIEPTINDIFDIPRERRIKVRQLAEKANPLFELELADLTKGYMANDFNLMPTKKALDCFLGEDADLFYSQQKSKNIISNERIEQKDLFFNIVLHDEVDFLTKSLMNENFVNLQARMTHLSLSKGIAVIFHGASGTGKTETAYQIARRTGRDILKVDISQTKSMWFGESEKLIKKVFVDYERTCKQCHLKPILLFNEADAILGKRQENNRSNVSQTENAIQNILLEEMERFEGIMIATTNLQGNLDSAFERRFLFKIEFSLPSIEAKTKIWTSKLSWLSDDLAIQLAKDYSFSGGEIDNIIRKITIKEILSGCRPDKTEILQLCQSEKLMSSNKGNKIGYF
ncbi:MAG: ATP-binding protein [Bacteroidales bacterium]|nr:ATP-binding protein [Bacteroidales bacterium]